MATEKNFDSFSIKTPNYIKKMFLYNFAETVKPKCKT